MTYFLIGILLGTVGYQLFKAFRRPRIRLTRFLRLTPGGTHAWYEARIGSFTFPVRKPVQ